MNYPYIIVFQSFLRFYRRHSALGVGGGDICNWFQPLLRFYADGLGITDVMLTMTFQPFLRFYGSTSSCEATVW